MKFLRKLISRKTLLLIAFAMVLGQCMDPSLAFAAAAADKNEMLEAFAQLFSVFVNIFTFLSLVFLNYGGDLVGTSFLTAPDPMATIRPMWVIVRNITNIMFVLVLLFLAFSNLFSSFGQNGNWTIKEKLPKIILALIAINFSLLGFKVVLDAVYVGTITIFAIPDTALQDKGKNNLQEVLLTAVEDPDNENSSLPFYAVMNNLMCGKDQWEDPNKKLKNGSDYPALRDPLPDNCLFAINPDRVEAKSSAAQNLFLAFGIQFQKLQQLPALAAKLNDWTDVLTSVLFVSILSLAQVVALGAVFIALLLRVVVLWIAMVFSPFLIAASVMGFGGEGGDLGKKVITNLIMPLKVAAAFAVSFLMMDTMMDIKGPSGDFVQTGMSISTFGSTGYGLLWSIATIVVFWETAFWAMNGSAGEGIAKTIKGGAEHAGKFLAKAGTVDQDILPMIGSKSGGKTSLTALYRQTGAVERFHNRTVDKKATEQSEILGLSEPGTAEKKSTVQKKIDVLSDKSQWNDDLLDFMIQNGSEVLRTDKDIAKLLYMKLSETTRSNLNVKNAEEFANLFAEAQNNNQVKDIFNKTDKFNKKKVDNITDKGTAADANKDESTADETTIAYVVKKGSEPNATEKEAQEIKFNSQVLIDNKKPAIEDIDDYLKRAGITQKELKDVVAGAKGMDKIVATIKKVDGWGDLEDNDILVALKKIKYEK